MDLFLLLKFGYAIPFLAYASYTDIRTRKVSNWVWVSMFSGILTFLAYDAVIHNISGLINAFSMLFITIVVVYIMLHYFHFGGADAKALLALSLLIPPILFSTVSNAAIFGLLIVAIMFVINRKIDWRIDIPFLPAIFMGFIVAGIHGNLIKEAVSWAMQY